MSDLTPLEDVVTRLRSPGGCPWDREQTFRSLSPYVIEEAYELSESLDLGNVDNVREELGDVLLHVVMISEMAKEKGLFAVTDVISDITEKMIRRHPHVFGNLQVDSVDDVWRNWDEIKKQEKGNQGPFDSVPVSLPALIRAEKIQKRSKKMGVSEPGFDELVSVIREMAASPNLKDRFGEFLYLIVRMARYLDVDPEEVLRIYTREEVSRLVD